MSNINLPERFIKFIDAAGALAAAGQKVTYAAVLAQAGGRGSMTDVAEAIKLWRAQSAEANKPALVRHELPDEQREAVLSLVAQLWEKAEQDAQALIERERQALDLQRKENEDEKAQALAAADQYLAERDAAQAELASLTPQLEQLHTENAELTRGVRTREAEMADLQRQFEDERLRREDAEGKLKVAAADVDRLKSEVTGMRENLSVQTMKTEGAERRADLAQGNVNALTEQLQKREEIIEKERELRMFAETKVGIATALAEDRATRLDALDKERNELRATASAAQVLIAELRTAADAAATSAAKEVDQLRATAEQALSDLQAERARVADLIAQLAGRSNPPKEAKV